MRWASSQLTRIIIQHRSHVINEINGSDDDFNGSLKITCGGWFISMCYRFQMRMEEKKKKEMDSYKLGKLMRFFSQRNINKLTMSPKSMNTDNEQWPERPIEIYRRWKTTRLICICLRFCCSVFFSVLLYLLLFFTYFLFGLCVFSSGITHIFKCQTYLIFTS